MATADVASDANIVWSGSDSTYAPHSTRSRLLIPVAELDAVLTSTKIELSALTVGLTESESDVEYVEETVDKTNVCRNRNRQFRVFSMARIQNVPCSFGPPEFN